MAARKAIKKDLTNYYSDWADTLDKQERSYEHEPSTVAEYSQGIGSTDVAQEKSDDGTNWFDVIANQPKMIAEYWLEALPGARRILSPLGSVAATGSLANAWEGSKYHGPWDYFRNLKTTQLNRADLDESKLAKTSASNLANEGFIKISKTNQDEENLIPYLDNEFANNMLTQEKYIQELGNLLNSEGFTIKNSADIQRYAEGNPEFQAYATALHDEMSKSMYTQEDMYEDNDNYYVRNFKEVEDGVNIAWTRYGDLQLPQLGTFKFDEEGKGSMLTPGASSYEGFLGLEQLQDVGFLGLSETDPDLLYQGLLGNEDTKRMSQMVAMPAAIATGNLKGILHTPQAIAQGAKLLSKPTRGLRRTPGQVSPGFGLPNTPRVPGIPEQALRETAKAPWTMAKLPFSMAKALRGQKPIVKGMAAGITGLPIAASILPE
jgi:hypothetical protein